MSDLKEDGAALTVHYTLTLGDYRAMVAAGQDRASRWLSRWAFWPLVIVNMIFGFVILIDRIEANDPLGWTSWFNVAIAALLLLARYVAKPIWLHYAFKTTRLGGRDYKVMLGQEAVVLKAGGICSTLSLDEIIGVQETADHFFFWFNKRQAVIVPKRALDGAEDDGAIRHYIQTHHWELRS